MKIPEYIKQDIIDCMDEAIVVNETGDAHDLLDFADKAHVCMATALTYIQQLESTVSEKEKVIAELLEKIEQLKRERDAAVNDLSTGLRCNACKKFFKNNNNVGCSGGLYCIPFRFEWRGVCPENAEVQDGNK